MKSNPFKKFLNEADKIIEKYEEEKAMEEKRITKEEFDNAVHEVMENIVKDEDLEGIAKLMIPMTGAMFATQMRNILFGDNQEGK